MKQISAMIFLAYITLNPLASFGATQYSFFLHVISEDQDVQMNITESFERNILAFKNLKIHKEKIGVHLFIYGKKHQNSETHKNIISFSIVHTNNLDIYHLVNEAFDDNHNTPESLKQIAVDLIREEGGLLKYLNTAMIDDISLIDTVVQEILSNLSFRIKNYYE